MFKGCQTVTFYANDMTSNWEVWMIWHFKFYVLLANSTMMSSLSQEYENIEPGDYKSVSEKQPRTQENKLEKKNRKWGWRCRQWWQNTHGKSIWRS